MMKRVMVVEDRTDELAAIERMLAEQGYRVVAGCASGELAVELCKRERPDLIIMDASAPGAMAVLAQGFMMKHCHAPVVLLAGGGSTEEEIRQAIASGAMAYLTKPLRKHELIGAMELALSRFKEFERLRRENEDLKKTLEARKLIERAKGLLMEKEGLSESEAFARLRKISMDKRKPMKDIAEVIILALERDEKN